MGLVVSNCAVLPMAKVPTRFLYALKSITPAVADLPVALRDCGELFQPAYCRLLTTAR